MLNKVCFIVLLAVVSYDLTDADFFEECDGKEGTYVEIKEDCSFYIFCHGEDSFRDSCPDDNPYFSIEEQTCDANRSVCKDRAIISEILTSEEEEEEDEEEVSSTASSSVSASSTSITTASAATSNSSTPGTTASSSITLTVASSTTINLINSTAATQSVASVSPSPFVPPSSCPFFDNPNQVIFLPHTKSCSEYFLCYRGERLSLRCSNMLHFDVRQQKCDHPENVQCHMMDVASPREQCLPYTFDFYPHSRNCNYYYQCILGYLRVMQCPLNMGWHYEKRACVWRSQAKCYNSL